jgi:hypothetical protein
MAFLKRLAGGLAGLALLAGCLGSRNGNYEYSFSKNPEFLYGYKIDKKDKPLLNTLAGIINGSIKVKLTERGYEFYGPSFENPSAEKEALRMADEIGDENGEITRSELEALAKSVYQEYAQ